MRALLIVLVLSAATFAEARNVLLMYGLAHDVHNQHLLPSVRTLPQILRAARYRTGLVGKKHILPDEALPFDEELAPEQPGNRDVAFMAAQARKFIAKSGDRPFLLIVGYSDPHRAPENFGNTRAWPDVARQTYEPSQVVVPAHLPNLPEVRRDLADYYESISRLDSGVGLLLDALRETTHSDDTLVIYLSDNGRPFPGAKTTLYDDDIHLPLIASSPAQSKRGVRNDAMVSWVDIMPTILDWAGVPAPQTQQLAGRSILPILEQTSSVSARAAWKHFCIGLRRSSTICGTTLQRYAISRPIPGIDKCWNACAPRWRSFAPTRAILGRPSRLVAASARFIASSATFLATVGPLPLISVAGTR